MRNFTKTALATACLLGAGTASAGTEACFEVYKVTPNGTVDGIVAAHGTPYTLAGCNSTRGVAGAGTLATIVNPTVAWELTGDVDLNLESLGAVPRTHIVYIPTTDVPPASRIRMQLDGANFGTGNANQIYLVSLDGNGDYQTVASSDGAFDDTDTVEFLTKAGVTIGAGTRLLLSTLNPVDDPEADNLIEGISINIQNEETCNPSPEVTISAISAVTDGDTIILGAVSDLADGATAIIDISEQFAIVANPQVTNEILVDAEDPSFRQQFVVSKVTGDWVGQVIPTDGAIDTAAYWETQFTNDFAAFDSAVTLDADDEIQVAVSADSGTGDGVTLSFLANVGQNGQASIGNGSVLDEAEDDHLGIDADDDIELVDIDDNATDLLPLTETPTTYVIDANEIWGTTATSDIYVAARLMNSDDEIMEFNYDVNTTWSLDFQDASLLNKNGCETPIPFNVGVNGAVLKVPYTFTNTGAGFVRITSEHSSEATIFMDIFDESSNETKNINLGLIQSKSSEVLATSDLLASAVAGGYVGTGTRHTMTFTVTAPKNKVHGVSVMKIPGGVDRVMPVLDQNDWSQ
jgi:hypothetical protein